MFRRQPFPLRSEQFPKRHDTVQREPPGTPGQKPRQWRLGTRWESRALASALCRSVLLTWARVSSAETWKWPGGGDVGAFLGVKGSPVQIRPSRRSAKPAGHGKSQGQRAHLCRCSHSRCPSTRRSLGPLWDHLAVKCALSAVPASVMDWSSGCRYRWVVTSDP